MKKRLRLWFGKTSGCQKTGTLTQTKKKMIKLGRKLITFKIKSEN